MRNKIQAENLLLHLRGAVVIFMLYSQRLGEEEEEEEWEEKEEGCLSPSLSLPSAVYL